MTTETQTFEEISKEVVRNFIGNVLCIDDKACYRGDALPPLPSDMQEPNERFTTQASPISENATEAENDVESATRFNALQVIKEFNNNGILCSVISDDNINEHLVKVHKKVDVIIFDWEMGDGGTKALEGIKTVVDIDSSVEPRLRVIAIYTGHTDLLSVVNDVSAKLAGFKRDDEKLRLVKGHTLITVLAKESTNVATRYQNRITPYSKLPDKIIEEFSTITTGLISNTAISAITAIRDNTHTILGHFSSKYDPAYLADIALRESVQDGAEIVNEMLVSSISSILDLNNTINSCTSENIEKWFCKNEFSERPFSETKGAKSVSLEARKSCVVEGIKGGLVRHKILSKSNIDKKSNFNKYLKKGLFVNLFCPDDVDSEHLFEDYSVLSLVKSDYRTVHYTPKLTLGSVVRQKKGGKYFFCIQQRCESIRLTENEERGFLFLPLENVKIDEEFDILFYSSIEGKYKYLKIPNVSHKLQVIKFVSQQSSDEVVAKKETEGHFLFKSVDYGELIWILDIKDNIAQRISNAYSSQLSRVGIDVSEWLRHSSSSY